MIPRDLTDLWKEIAGKVWVLGFEDALTKPDRNQCTRVILHKDTNPEIISSLPAVFAKEPVEYVIQGTETAPDCGQPGHQCACGSGPK